MALEMAAEANSAAASALEGALQACFCAAGALEMVAPACRASALRMAALACCGSATPQKGCSSPLRCCQCVQNCCSSLLFEITIRKCWSRLRSALSHCSLLHFAPCMDMRGFTQRSQARLSAASALKDAVRACCPRSLFESAGLGFTLL